MEIEVIRSNNWRNKIKLKHMLDVDTSKEKVVSICEYLKPKLQTLKDKEDSGNLISEHKDYVDNSLFELIDQLEFIVSLSKTSEKEWEEYDFDGDFKTIFNDCLSELYDLGDTRVTTIEGVSEKFLWIE